MTTSTCARNLPQHFNGCACTAVPGAVLAEAGDIDLTSSGANLSASGDTGPMDTRIARIGERYDRDGKTYEVVRLTPAGSAGTSHADGPTVHAKIVRDDGSLSDFTADIWSGSTTYPASEFTMSAPAPYSFGDSIPEQETMFDIRIEPLVDDEGQDYLRVSYGEGHKESINLDSESFDRVVDSATSHLPPPEPHHYDFALYEWMEDARWRAKGLTQKW